ncbi:MAG: trypsin-like peptidase domain-containing protein [Oligoflexia bacterium]|nr:trypsin-like peptidase domain-containing protein [Oligoflexia bacterium]
MNGIQLLFGIFLLFSIIGFGFTPLQAFVTVDGDQNINLNDSPNISRLPDKSIIGNVDWQSIANFNRDSNIYKTSTPIGLLNIFYKGGSASRCTAFLISDDLIMTNWHCAPSATEFKGARFYLDFLTGKNRNDFLKTPYYDCNNLVLTYRPLDVALLRCSGLPGRTNGKVKLEGEQRNYYPNPKIYVIHQNCDYHYTPGCAPTKKFSPVMMLSKSDGYGDLNNIDIFYDADTLGGSSGSPVFLVENNKVIALHHLGHNNSNGLANANADADADANANDDGRGVANSGVPMYKILSYIKEQLPELRDVVDLGK